MTGILTRTAVVGVGSMGRNHARVYQELPDVELVAVVDTDEVAADKIAQFYQIPAYQDYREMVEQAKPQAVSVAVPTSEHFRVVRDLLEMGCHVLVEKPIAASCDEARSLIEVAQRTGKVLTVGHIERFNPAITELKRRLDEGQLGGIFQIHARRLGPFPSRIQDVGVILDLAPHDLDIMRYLSGHEVVRLYAESRNNIHCDHEDLVTGIVRFANDALGILEINWLTPTKIRELYVTGERGMFMANYITQDLFFYENALAHGNEWQAMSLLRGVSEGAMTRYAVRKTEPLRSELETFVQRVRTGEGPYVDPEDALEVLRLALAMEDAARYGGVREMRQATVR